MLPKDSALSSHYVSPAHRGGAGWRGAVGGAAMTAGAFLAYQMYDPLRPRHYSIEFAVVVFLGALPGLVVYYLPMRNQFVRSSDIVPPKLS